MNYDIFLCCAKKDYNKLKYTVQAIKNNVIGYNKIYLCTPTRENFGIDGITNVIDREVLDLNPFQFKHRPGWIYQQFLKLFQDVTESDYYATIDVDIIINKKMSYFNNEGRPIWYMGCEQNHKPYFDYQEKMFGYGRVHDHTFIADMNFFNKKIIREMLSVHGYTYDSFIRKSCEVINQNCYIAEPELYGSYIHKYHPGMYEYRHLNFNLKGKDQIDPNQLIYTDQEIVNLINENKGNGYDIVTLHSWCANSENIWGY